MIGRMIACSPLDAVRYFLRMLLCYKTGPTSFEDLRTIEGVTYTSYRDACRAARLLEDDTEWDKSIQEASVFNMPKQLRNLFAIILVYCQPADIKVLWCKHIHSLSEDFQHFYKSTETDPKVILKTISSINALSFKIINRFLIFHSCLN